MAAPPELDPERSSTRTVDRLELLSAILMAVAAVATAWSSYQATRWNGEQAEAASQTNAIRIDAARASELASAETEIDVATFIAWADAHGRGEFELARFHEDRFREEFVPAFEAWMAADPFEDPNAPATPFAMDDYRVAAEQHAEELDEQAEDGAAAVRRNIQQAGDYMLAVVLFAVALFFGGMSSKLASVRLRAAMVACGYVVLLGTLVWVASAPISLHS